MKHPIDNVTWVHVDLLISNSYNPNSVMTAEMKLLERSLLATKWVQPILVISLDDLTIVDGFHRATLAKTSAALQKRDGGLVPVAPLNISRAEAIITTVRMNRAKGTHAALAMSDLVCELVNDHKLKPKVVAEELGAHIDEINLLLTGGDIFKARKLEGRDYSKAWIPREDGRKSSDVYKGEA